MEWELVYLSIYRFYQDDEDKRRTMEEIATLSANDSYEDRFPFLQEYLSDMIRQAKGKKASLSPSASCRAWRFRIEDEAGQEDKNLCDALLGSVSKSTFQNHAQILAQRYTRIPKSRNGLLFVLNANTMQGKNLAPSLLIFKADFRSAALVNEDKAIKENHEILLSDLKKCMWYPHFDGFNHNLDQIRIFQSSASDYFQKLLNVVDLPDSVDIAEEALREELFEIHPEVYEKYFQIPEQERHQKREVFGERRYVAEEDLLEPEKVAQLAVKAQIRNIDQNAKPLRLRLNIDGGLKFEGSIDLLGQTFFFAKHGDEKILILRGDKFETKSHYQPIEFLKLESLESVIQKLGEPRYEVLEQSLSEDE
ncbi:MAG: DUF3900 domain-containing protein [Candidatus Cloacimonetes bacterium]|nr:DUF3900 domain-containing protein [Candidatus Cloacimonadota bacterium]